MFVAADNAVAVFVALPDGVTWSAEDERRAVQSDQVRLWWGRTPVDLFFQASPFHDDVARRAVRQRFAEVDVPFLAAEDLAVFKALFDRPKDWLDIEAMVAAAAITPRSVAETLRSLVGDDLVVDRMRALGR